MDRPQNSYTWLRSFKIRHYTSKYGLMRHDQYFSLSEQCLNNAIDTLQQIQIRFAVRITIFQFVLITPSKLLRKPFLNFFVGKALANTLQFKEYNIRII